MSDIYPYHNVRCNAKLHEMENKMATSDGCSRQLREMVPSFTFAMHWHKLRSRSIGKCFVRTFIFVFMSTMQGKIVGQMYRNVLYYSGIVILPFAVPCVQIRAGFDFRFFNSFAVKAAPRLFDIFSSKNTAAFTPANMVCQQYVKNISRRRYVMYQQNSLLSIYFYLNITLFQYY